MLIMGFGNKCRQGKDTAVEAIVDYFNRENKIRQIHGAIFNGGIKVGAFKFATALYKEVNNYLQQIGGPENIGVVALDGVILPDWVQREPNPEINETFPYGKHPKLLQWWGTDFRRNNFGNNYWTNEAFSSIPSNLDVALFSDVRFLNEAQGIKDRGGYTVNVTRLNADGTQFFATDRPSDHPSETALDNYNWDFRLVNSANHAALLGEQAITLTEYLRGLSK